MYSTNLDRTLRISDVQFIPPRRGADDDDILGRLSFLVNGFIQFKNLLVHRAADDGFQIEFPTADPTGSGLPFLREDILAAIESRVLSVLAAEVG